MVMRYKAVAIFIVCLVCVGAFAWYQSLPRGRAGSTNYWVIYTLTPNGNHTQIQANYSDGVVTTNQVYWLDFNNRTAVYNYFKCTPSMPDCTLDGCSFTVLNDTATEYRVRAGDPCGP